MDLLKEEEEKYFANFETKITCTVSIYKFERFIVIYPFYNFIDRSVLIQYEEAVDNIILQFIKPFLVSISDEDYITNELKHRYADDFVYSCRFIYLNEKTKINWNRIWNTLNKLFLIK